MDLKNYQKVAQNCPEFHSRTQELTLGLVDREPSCLDCENFIFNHCKKDLYDAIIQDLY